MERAVDQLQLDKPRGWKSKRRNPGGKHWSDRRSDVLLLWPVHKPCLAKAAVTSWAKVDRCVDSWRLMLPAEERRGEVPPVSIPGEWVMMISAPWSTRALAVSLKVSLWFSIWKERRERFFIYVHLCTGGVNKCLMIIKMCTSYVRAFTVTNQTSYRQAIHYI